MNKKTTHLLLGILCCFLFGLTSCDETGDIGMFGEISGKVTDYETGNPIDKATINVTPSGISIQTDAGGYYNLNRLDPEQYTLTIQKVGYQTDRKTIKVLRGENLEVNIQLRAIPTE